ncbi:hypothetical protein M422DRAFT_78011, partial [Sphaerobolus stellatus SS14]
CCNLPEGIRLLHENIFLGDIVNGPKQSSLTQSNHYIRPFIDDFRDFWNQGYQFPETPIHPKGVTIKGTVIPLIMDLKALRQIMGYAAHNAHIFCTYCLLLHNYIDDVANPAQWPPMRPLKEHRELANSWLNAPSEAQQEAIFNEHCLRWSEFLRLEYVDPQQFMVIDTMH